MRIRLARGLVFLGLLTLPACVAVSSGGWQGAQREQAERDALDAAHAAALGCGASCRPKECSPPTSPGCHDDSVPCACWCEYQPRGKRPACALLREIVDLATKWMSDPACDDACRECWRQVAAEAVLCSMSDPNHVGSTPHGCRSCHALYFDVERAWQHAQSKEGAKGALCELRHSDYGG